MKGLSIAATSVLTLVAAASAHAAPVTFNQSVTKRCSNITQKEVEAAQQNWAQGIVAIGAAGDPEGTASTFIDKYYAYGLAPVMFKPTKASKVPFRDTKAEALSYFTGGTVRDGTATEVDHGFALSHYINVRFENHQISGDCDSALAQGKYYFTNEEGHVTDVEYTFGYIRDKRGALRIQLHHSSLPYQPSGMRKQDDAI